MGFFKASFKGFGDTLWASLGLALLELAASKLGKSNVFKHGASCHVGTAFLFSPRIPLHASSLNPKPENP